jgi:hypothetical protein
VKKYPRQGSLPQRQLVGLSPLCFPVSDDLRIAVLVVEGKFFVIVTVFLGEEGEFVELYGWMKQCKWRNWANTSN